MNEREKYEVILYFGMIFLMASINYELPRTLFVIVLTALGIVLILVYFQNLYDKIDSITKNMEVLKYGRRKKFKGPKNR